MNAADSDLLTTSEAAALLRSSRQHVVDLCERGLLPFVKVGAHRRLPRRDLEALLRPPLTRDQRRSLWLHAAVASRLVKDPDGVLRRASRNLDRLRRVHADGSAAKWLDRWSAILDSGVETVLSILTSRDPDAADLRQNSPFAGVLSEADRTSVLRAFAATWQLEHAA